MNLILSNVFLQFLTTWWGMLIFIAGIILVWTLISIIFYKVFFKRFYDILLSGIALIVLSPIIALVAILVRVKLGSPVVFSQERPLKKGIVKKIHKFRTMTDSCDKEGNLLPDSERLTKFGKLLRSTSLDELPQLWDIFIGRLSIVGPRPLLVRYLPLYNEEQSKRHNVRPGLTGLAQVNGRNAISWEKKFEYDVKYVNQVSLFLDIKIIFMTIGKVFKRKGINQGESVTMSAFKGNGKKLAIYCSGGMGEEVFDLADRNNNGRWKEIFFVDDFAENHSYRNAKILKFAEIYKKDVNDIEFVVANGEPFVRKDLTEKIKKEGFALATIIDKSAIVSKTASIGAGSIICSNCFISSNVIIGESCLMQPTSNIGHESKMGDYSILSSFSVVSGSCNISRLVYVGVSVPIKEKIFIGEGSIIGMGSVVLRDIPENMIALGNPARPMKENENQRVFNKNL